MKYLLPALRVLTGAVFAVSGYLKLLAPVENFAVVIRGYEILGPAASGITAAVLPWAELMAGLALAAGLWTRFSLGVLWTLNTALVAVVAQAIVRRLPVGSCGCFGEAFPLTLRQILVIDTVLWGVLTTLIWRRRETRVFSLDARFDRRDV